VESEVSQWISVRVKDFMGTIRQPCRCKRWLIHWERFSGQGIPMFCPVIGCDGAAEVGAHVRRDGPGDQKWHIVPLCRKHRSQRGAVLMISSSIALVSADVGETCGRRNG
jgi:hypothetical protein